MKKTKICHVCHKEREYKNGHLIRCVECCRKYRRKYYIKNKELEKRKAVLYRKNNPEKIKLLNKKYNEKHVNKNKLRMKKYRIENSEKVNKCNKKWRKSNPEKYREISRKYYQKRLSSIDGRLNNSMGKMFWCALKKNKAGKHWEDLINYTLNDLKKHLEMLFTQEMTWDNYGEWHIDHIVPKVVFKFESYNDIGFKECWALKNLQPLWATTRVIDGVEYMGNLNKAKKLIRRTYGCY